MRMHTKGLPGRARRNGESGMAMAVVLFTVILVMIVSGTLVALAMNEYQLAGSAETSRQGLMLAEAGIELGIHRLKLDSDWGDSTGATGGVVNNGEWYYLRDGLTPVSERDFPVSNPIGKVSVEVCRSSASPCPGAVNSASVEGCDSQTCIWLQATGKVGRSTKRIQVLLGKTFPGIDTPNYSNSMVNLGAGGGGLGSFTMHGSLYIANCIVNASGQCVGLQMQGDGGVFNDIPYSTPTETPDVAPFNNKLYVRGMILGQGGSWNIGTAAQPMSGVFATGGWPATNENQIHAFSKGREVPIIAFPDPSRQCDPTDIRTCLISRIYYAADPLPIANVMTAYVCVESGDCSQAQWKVVDLGNAVNVNEPLPFCATGCRTPWGNNQRTRIVIPSQQASPVQCTSSVAASNVCNAAVNNVGTSSLGSDFALVFNGTSAISAGQNNLRVRRGATTPTDSGAFIHTKRPLEFTGSVRYDAFSTIIVENDLNWYDGFNQANDIVALRINGNVTPVARASLTGTTFGLPIGSGGNSLAFAVGPACSTTNPTSCTPPSGGGVYLRGGLEINLVLVAHGRVKNDTAGQAWYGLFIADRLDWDNNPDIFMIDGLMKNPPPGIADLNRGGFSVSIYRWREFF